MLIPTAAFSCCLSSRRPPAGRSSAARSLISAITAHLEALARKAAKGFVFSTGDLQLQGPASLNPTAGQGDWGASFFLSQ